MNPEKLNREHMERVGASQRRGHWLPLTGRIAELRFKAKLREPTAADMATLDACKRKLDDDLETVMRASGQEPT